MSASETDTDPAQLRAELDRLRELVGPSEESYTDLRHELLAARDAARGAQATAGTLRGQLVELEVALGRARQDQEHFHKTVFSAIRFGRRRIGRAVRSRLL